MSISSVSCTVLARAALAGNPSDGHGGAVVATVVPSLSTTVAATPAEQFRFAGSPDEVGSMAELSARLAERQPLGDQPLVQAALVVLHRHINEDLAPHAFHFSTTIPRSLGLAGSSAIVIGAIRAALAAHHHRSWARDLTDRPELIAGLALEAERDVLGIAAGLQDRVVQAFGATMEMEFATTHMRTEQGVSVGAYRELGPLPQGCFVAYRTGTARDSGLVHGAIDPLDEQVRRAMARSADAARAAADAIDRSDAGDLAIAMNETFDERAAVFQLDPAHVEMIEIARSCDAGANYAGSGGAVTVVAPDGRAASALTDLGCTVVQL